MSIGDAMTGPGMVLRAASHWHNTPLETHTHTHTRTQGGEPYQVKQVLNNVRVLHKLCGATAEELQ